MGVERQGPRRPFPSQVGGGSATDGAYGGGALELDGVDDYLELPAAVKVAGTAPRSVCLWARVDAFDRKMALFSYGAAASGAEFGLTTMTVFERFNLQFYGASWDLEVDLPGAGTGWHHYCLTFETPVATLYFDGAVAATVSRVLATGVDLPFYVGNRGVQGMDHGFAGAVDDVVVYDVAIDADAVVALFETTTAAPTAAPTRDECADLWAAAGAPATFAWVPDWLSWDNIIKDELVGTLDVDVGESQCGNQPLVQTGLTNLETRLARSK